jgi:hypothetical protein
VGCGVLCAALIIGCGGSSEDAVMKEQLKIMDDMIALMQKNKDLTKLKDDPDYKKLEARGKELEKTMNSWPKEKQEEMKKKYEKEMTDRVAKLLGGAFKQ